MMLPMICLRIETLIALVLFGQNIGLFALSNGDFGPGLFNLWLSTCLTRGSSSREDRTSDICGRNFASRMHCNANKRAYSKFSDRSKQKMEKKRRITKKESPRAAPIATLILIAHESGRAPPANAIAHSRTEV
ncbi:hypothetical protein SDJN02_18828, partial [Cucurbita argyrosperma subsp. argyrosperma]